MSKVESGIKSHGSLAKDAMSMDDLKKLISGLRSDCRYNWEAYVRLSFITAMRSSDVLMLKWGDILNKECIYFTEKKTRKTREISISESNSDVLNELYALSGKPDKSNYILESSFWRAKNNESYPMTVQYVNRALKDMKFKYKLDIDVNKIATHSFRKAFGKYVYENNGKSFEALNMLNIIFKHSSIKTTQRYLGIESEKINNIFNKLEL